MRSPTLFLLIKFDDFLKKYNTSRTFFKFNMALLGTLVNFDVRFYWLRHPIRKIKLTRKLKCCKQK